MSALIAFVVRTAKDLNGSGAKKWQTAGQRCHSSLVSAGILMKPSSDTCTQSAGAAVDTLLHYLTPCHKAVLQHVCYECAICFVKVEVKKEGQASLGALLCHLVSEGASEADAGQLTAPFKTGWHLSLPRHTTQEPPPPRAPRPHELCQQLVPSANQPVI